MYCTKFSWSGNHTCIHFLWLCRGNNCTCLARVPWSSAGVNVVNVKVPTLDSHPVYDSLVDLPDDCLQGHILSVLSTTSPRRVALIQSKIWRKGPKKASYLGHFEESYIACSCHPFDCLIVHPLLRNLFAFIPLWISCSIQFRFPQRGSTPLPRPPMSIKSGFVRALSVWRPLGSNSSRNNNKDIGPLVLNVTIYDSSD